MQDGPKVVWSISYIPVAFFSSLKHNCIAHRSSKVSSRPDYIFEIHQLWQSGFSRVYSNFCCSCSFEPEVIKIGQSSHKMYRNNILNFQELTTILNACTKKFWKLIERTTYTCKKGLYRWVNIYYRNVVDTFCPRWPWYSNSRESLRRTPTVGVRNNHMRNCRIFYKNLLVTCRATKIDLNFGVNKLPALGGRSRS